MEVPGEQAHIPSLHYSISARYPQTLGRQGFAGNSIFKQVENSQPGYLFFWKRTL